jgi:hypothetical protein
MGRLRNFGPESGFGVLKNFLYSWFDSSSDLIRISNEFSTNRKTKALNQIKAKCKRHENATNNYILPKLI